MRESSGKKISRKNLLKARGFWVVIQGVLGGVGKVSGRDFKGTSQEGSGGCWDLWEDVRSWKTASQRSCEGGLRVYRDCEEDVKKVNLKVDLEREVVEKNFKGTSCNPEEAIFRTSGMARFQIHNKGFGRGFWNVEGEFTIVFQGISGGFWDEWDGVGGLRGRSLGYMKVISRIFQGDDS